MPPTDTERLNMLDKFSAYHWLQFLIAYKYKKQTEKISLREVADEVIKCGGLVEWIDMIKKG